MDQDEGQTDTEIILRYCSILKMETLTLRQTLRSVKTNETKSLNANASGKRRNQRCCKWDKTV